ncbi:MAG: hypothetical protein NZL91_01605, partial [Thermoflexales bacterium]|nr:hypothetical protein [Thermoflexales bacterium]
MSNEEQKRSRSLAVMLGALVLLLAAWLRLWGLAETEIGLHYDEAAMLLLARNIAFGGSRPIFIEAYTGHEVAFHYLAALVLCFGSDSVFGLRLTAAWVGILTVAAAFAATRALFGKHPQARWIAALAALGVAVAFPHLLLSRYGFRAIAQPLFQSLAVAALWIAMRMRRYRWFVAGGVLSGAVLHTYLAARLFPLPLLLALALWAWQTHAWWALRRLAAAFAGAAAVVAPLAIFFVQRPHALTVRIAQVAAPTLESAIDGVLKVARAFFLPGYGDPYIRFNLPGTPLLDPISAVLFVVGLGALLRWRAGDPEQRSARLLIIAALLVMSLASALATSEITPSNLRLIGVYPFIAILPAMGASALLEGLARLCAAPARARHYAALLIALALLGMLYTRQRYVSWAASPELFRENHGDMAVIARALDTLDLRSTTAYILSEHYRHPTVAALARHYSRAKWITGGASLVLPPSGSATYFVPSWLLPPAPWPAAVATRWQAKPLRAHNGAVVAQQVTLSAEAVRALRSALSPIQADFAHVVGVRAVQPVGECRAGERCVALVTWEILAPYPALQAVVRLFHPVLGEWGRANPFHYPTGEWTVGEIVIDQITVPLPSGVPPLRHRFGVGFFNPETMERLPRLDAQERFAGLEATFDAGIVQPSLASPSAAVSPCHDVAPIEQRGSAAVRLLSWAPLPPLLRSGERFMLELCWLSAERTEQLGATPVAVQLRNAQALRWLYRGSPAMGALPFSQWRANMLVRDRVIVRLPFDLPAGQHQLAVQVGERHVADL